MNVIGNAGNQECGLWLNNRAEIFLNRFERGKEDVGIQRFKNSAEIRRRSCLNL
jgi:hypothetical protein